MPVEAWAVWVAWECQVPQVVLVPQEQEPLQLEQMQQQFQAQITELRREVAARDEALQ